MDELVGKYLGQYEIVSLLGAGGSARVYKAYQQSMERHVALKVLPLPGYESRAFADRFAQEARLIANLEHPNIVPIFDFGEDKGYMYIAMRLVEGGTLADLLDGKPFSLDETHAIVSQVGSALQYAHSQGVVHRDIKPSNLLIDKHGNCMITDFGLAKVLEPAARISMTGTVIGTPAYMSPEQILAEEVDGRSDIYSLGAVMYELLTGLPPYKAESTAIVFIRHIQDPLPPAREFNPALPESIDIVFEHALAKRRDERYAQANDLVQALSGAMEGTLPLAPGVAPAAPRVSRRWLVALLPIVLVGLGLVAAAGFGGATFYLRVQDERATATNVSSDLRALSAAATAAQLQLDALRATLFASGGGRPAPTATTAASVAPATRTALAGSVSTTTLRPTATETATATATSTRGAGPVAAQGTIIFRECRGWEGTLTFGQADPRSLHAFGTLTFTVPRGDYRLHIDWTDHGDSNVDTSWTVRAGNQVVDFGDKCN